MDMSVAYERLQTLGQSALRALPMIGFALVVFFIFLLISRGVKKLVQSVTERHRQGNVGLLLGRLAQWGVIVLGVLLAVTIAFPTFTPANLIGALGITGIAIGFAFKDIFQNFLAGILILVTEPFRINDQIVHGPHEGTVEDIQTRATLLRTYDGRRVVIPNAELYTNAVVVNTAYDARRMEYDVGIGYGDDVDEARRLMLEAMRKVEGVLSDPAPEVLLVDLAGSSVNLRARWWVNPPRRLDTLEAQDRVLQAIKDTLAENGVDMPFPTQQILFHDQTEETDGDRRRQREGWPARPGEAPKPRSITGAIGHGGSSREPHRKWGREDDSESREQLPDCGRDTAFR